MAEVPHPSHKLVTIPHLGHPVILVDREKMRRRTNRRFFRRPHHKAQGTSLAPPLPPTTTDVSKGEKIKYPILGNDREGDCYYAAILHMVQSFLGQYGTEPNWDVSAVLARYERLSGGDNGLSDDDVYPEWKAGILGPNGPNKILDDLLINPTDTALIEMAIWRFTGVLLTVSLPGNWANSAAPGVTWTTPITGFVGGHAIILTGKNVHGGFDLRTWGISPPINVTPQGIAACDPEVIVVFGTQQYDPVSKLSPAGFTWEEDRALWIQYGGADVGPAPWVTPPAGMAMTASPASGGVPLSVSFSATGITSSSAVLDFGDGSPTQTLTTFGSGIATHVYPTVGTFTATITTADSKTATATISAGVVPPPPPPVPANLVVVIPDQTVQVPHGLFGSVSVTIPGGTYPVVDGTKAAINPAVFGDAIALLMAILSKNPAAISAAIAKLLSDLGLGHHEVGAINPAVFGDLIALVLAFLSKNPLAISAALAKLLADLGIGG